MATKRLKFLKLSDTETVQIEINPWNINKIIEKLGFKKNSSINNDSTNDQIFIFSNQYHEDINNQNCSNLTGLPQSSKIFTIYCSGEEELLNIKKEALSGTSYYGEQYDTFLDVISDEKLRNLYSFKDISPARKEVGNLKLLIGQTFIVFYDIAEIFDHHNDVMNEFDKMINRFITKYNITISPGSLLDDLLKKIKNLKTKGFNEMTTYILKKFWDEHISKIVQKLNSGNKNVSIAEEFGDDDILDTYSPVNLLKENIKLFKDKIKLFSELKNQIKIKSPEPIQEPTIKVATKTAKTNFEPKPEPFSESNDPSPNKYSKPTREFSGEIKEPKSNDRNDNRIIQENQELKRKLDELQIQNTELEAISNKNKTENNQLRTKVKKLEKELEDLNVLLEERNLNAENDQVEQLTSEIDDLKNEITNLKKKHEKELNNLKNQAKSNKNNNESNKKMLKDYKEYLINQLNEIDELDFLNQN